MTDTQIIRPFTRIPWSLISDEVSGVYGSTVLSEMSELIGFYDIYEKGAEFTTEGSKGDYVPSNLRYKEARKLIDKEARFLFSKHPDLWVNVPYDRSSPEAKKIAGDQMSALQTLVDNVIDRTMLFSKLVKAAKDCFIGKRVAYFINFDEENQRISLDFIPSLEFVYETDPEDTTVLSRIVTFYTIHDSKSKADQRIYKKKYWMENGLCHIHEAIYDGAGSLVEETTPDRATRFPFIPAGVVINDGLTGDTEGQSEIELLGEYESWYSRIANADIDAERQGMNPIRWAKDMSPESTQGLSICAGSFWDLSTDQNAADKVSGEVGVLETSMGYKDAVAATLSRIRSSMFETVDMPDLSPDALKGVVSSGKTLKAIYWSLIVRCEEKMLAWRPALQFIASTIIEGAKLYPKSAAPYLDEAVPNGVYEIRVENQYPLPEDEAEEKAVDLQEVAGQTMSKLAYMKKWRNLTDDEAMQELKQIALEREMLEESFGGMGMEEDTEEEDLEDPEEDIDDELDDVEDPEESELMKLLGELEGGL